MENDPDQRPPELENAMPPTASEPPHVTRRERMKRKRMLLIVVGGVILTLLVLGSLYWFLVMKDSKKEPTQKTTKEQAQTQQLPAPTPDDSAPVVYKSVKSNIELTHRKDWTLKESPSGEITVTSPRTSYTKLDGQSTTGVFTVKFRVGVPDAMKATVEKAVAVRDSEVIAYDDPTDNQRFYTNLSYAGQKDVFNFFVVTGNTALKAGNAFAYTLVLDAEFYLLVGGFGADKDGTLSFDSVAPSAISGETAQQGVAIVKSLKIF